MKVIKEKQIGCTRVSLVQIAKDFYDVQEHSEIIIENIRSCMGKCWSYNNWEDANKAFAEAVSDLEEE